VGLGQPEPEETYSTSEHLYTQLDIPSEATGILPRAMRARAGLEAEEVEDIGETGKVRSPRPRRGRGSPGRGRGGAAGGAAGGGATGGRAVSGGGSGSASGGASGRASSGASGRSSGGVPGGVPGGGDETVRQAAGRRRRRTRAGREIAPVQEAPRQKAS
jgi:hypothetical protein